MSAFIPSSNFNALRINIIPTNMMTGMTYAKMTALLAWPNPMLILTSCPIDKFLSFGRGMSIIFSFISDILQASMNFIAFKISRKMNVFHCKIHFRKVVFLSHLLWNTLSDTPTGFHCLLNWCGDYFLRQISRKGIYWNNFSYISLYKLYHVIFTEILIRL